MRQKTSGPLTVGELAQHTDCKVETVRYYEKIGLLPQPPRSPGGHRLYPFDSLKRLTFIRRSRELGFSIEQVRNLLHIIDEPHHTCGEVKALTLAQAHEIQQKINDLKRLQKALNDMASKCKGKSFNVNDCEIIDALYSGRGK